MATLRRGVEWGGRPFGLCCEMEVQAGVRCWVGICYGQLF